MAGPLQILIVEDSPDDAELVVLHLKHSGAPFEWRRVDTEPEYLAALAAGPDLILADFALPHFSAPRALQLLKERSLDIPFIIVSGTIGEETAVEAMKQGATDYLLKDRLARLESAVTRALEEKRWRDAQARDAREKEQLTVALRARVKELTVLHRTTRLLEANFQPVPDLLRDIALLLPDAFGRPEIAAVRLGYDTYAFASPQFAETPWRLSAAFVTHDGKRGLLEVAYLEEYPAGAGGPFLEEERTLLVTLAGMLGAHFDRRRAEAEIVSLARFPAENSNPVLRLDSTGTILYANEASRALLENWGCEIGSPAPEFWRALASEAMATSMGREIDIEYGGRVYAITVAPPVEGSHYINLYGLDITARRRAEESLRQSEHKFRSVVEQSTDGIVLTDDQGIVVEWNLGAERVTGLTRAEAVGRPIWDTLSQLLSGGPGGQRTAERFQSATQEYLKAGQAPWLNRMLENTVQRPDGTSGAVQAMIFPIKTDQGNMTCCIMRDITERKRAEEALQKAHDRLDATLSALPDFLFEVDETGRIYGYRAPQASELYAPPEAFLGRTVPEVLPPESAGVIMEAIQEAAANGNSFGRSYQLSLPDGPKWFELSVAVQGGTAAADKRLVVLVREITERKQAEKALRESEELHRTILQTAMDGFWLVDMQGRMLEVNETYCRMSGYSAQELLAMRIPFMEAAETADDTAAHAQRVMAQGEDRFKSRHRRKDGSVFEVEVSVKYQSSEDERLVVFLRDITERQRMEEAQAASAIENAQLLAETRHRLDELAAVSGAALAGAAGLSFDETVARATQDLARIWPEANLGFMFVDEADASLHLHSSYHGMPPEVIAGLRVPLSRGISGWAARERQPVRVGDVTADPHYVDLRSLADFESPVAPTRSEMAAPLAVGEHVIGVADVQSPHLSTFSEDDLRLLVTLAGQLATIFEKVRLDAALAVEHASLAQRVDERTAELHAANAQLRQAHTEVSQALEQERELSELKTRFISTTSHEFRTPLSIIQSSAELLEYYGHLFTEDKKLMHLRRIQASTGNMTKLLDDELLVSKAEAGRLEFAPAPLNVQQFCEDMAEELQLGAGARYEIVFSAEGDGTRANMDEKLLRHILGNLLSNAIKYSPQGGEVRFGLTCREGQAIFVVQDQGLGIPPEDLERLFEPFHRAGNAVGIPGTGLGLTIVKKSVEAHRGSIHVASVLHQGTTFTVTLPLGEPGT